MFLKNRLTNLFFKNTCLQAINKQSFGRNFAPLKVNFDQPEISKIKTENLQNDKLAKKVDNSQKIQNVEKDSKKQTGFKVENYGPYTHLGFETNIDELEVESHYQKKVLVKRENGNDHFYGKKQENFKRYDQKINKPKNEDFEDKNVEEKPYIRKINGKPQKFENKNNNRKYEKNKEEEEEEEEQNMEKMFESEQQRHAEPTWKPKSEINSQKNQENRENTESKKAQFVKTDQNNENKQRTFNKNPKKDDKPSHFNRSANQHERNNNTYNQRNEDGSRENNHNRNQFQKNDRPNKFSEKSNYSEKRQPDFPTGTKRYDANKRFDDDKRSDLSNRSQNPRYNDIKQAQQFNPNSQRNTRNISSQNNTQEINQNGSESEDKSRRQLKREYSKQVKIDEKITIKERSPYNNRPIIDGQKPPKEEYNNSKKKMPVKSFENKTDNRNEDQPQKPNRRNSFEGKKK